MDDSSTAPQTIHNRTAKDIEEKVIAIKKKTCFGPIRIADELKDQHGISLSHHTIRTILRRYKKSLNLQQHKPHKKGVRQFIDHAPVWHGRGVNEEYDRLDVLLART